MRQLNVPCLLGRHIGLSSYSPLGASRPTRPPIRASSLSAIHRGLRESEKARPQGFKPDSLSTPPSNNTRRSTSRSRADPDWVPPTFKLKKGKKNITDKGPQPKSRRLRFNDPDESFGKKSLVYQLRNSPLAQQSLQSRDQRRGSRNDARIPEDSRISEDAFMASFRESNGKDGPSKRLDKSPISAQQRPRRDDNRFTRDKGLPRDREPTRDRGFSRDREPRSDRGFPRDSEPVRDMRFPRDREPAGDKGFPRDREPARDRGFSRDREPAGDRGFPRDREPAGDRGFSRDREPPRDRGFPRDKEPPRDRGFPRDREPAGDRGFPRDREVTGDRGFTRDKPYTKRESTVQQESTFQQDRSSFRETEHPREENSPTPPPKQQQQQDDDKYDGPIRIHHTTAASQFLYGRSVVEAALKNSRRQLYNLYIYNGEDRQNLSQDASLEKLARARGVKINKVGRDGQRMLDRMSVGRTHNGCVLEASPLPQLPLKALGATSDDTSKPGYAVSLAYQTVEEAEINGTLDFVSCQVPRERKPFVLLVDGILDPGNLGAILRSAAFLGVNAVAISKHNSATLTPVAIKASAGAAEVMTLFSVKSTVDFLIRSKESGWMVYAAVPSTSRSRGNSHLTIDRVETYDPLAMRPTILVVGSEGEGLDKQVRREADFEVSIPSASGLLSVVDSLNVSVATGILCSAFLKKQQTGIEIEGSVPTEEKEEALW